MPPIGDTFHCLHRESGTPETTASRFRLGGPLERYRYHALAPSVARVDRLRTAVKVVCEIVGALTVRGGCAGQLRTFSQAVREAILRDALPAGTADGRGPAGTTAL
jgi:hypothetical protein